MRSQYSMSNLIHELGPLDLGGLMPQDSNLHCMISCMKLSLYMLGANSSLHFL